MDSSFTLPGVGRLPLRKRDGRIIYTTVDLADFADFSQWRWFLSSEGYVARNAPDARPGRRYRFTLMARVILGLDYGDPRESDHINRNPRDNRRSNLRIVTQRENAQNRKRTDGSSKYRGVSFVKARAENPRPWQAYGCKDGKQNHLGFFAREEDAAAASAAWRRANLPYAME